MLGVSLVKKSPYVGLVNTQNTIYMTKESEVAIANKLSFY